MCGICGIVFFKNKIRNNQVDEMLHHLKHRGPDSTHIYHSNVLTMGMSRLAINDVDHGKQPFFNEDKNISVMYNGEIYNHHSLREELMRKGYKFYTRCDGEVIPALFQEYGIDFLQKIDGMYAMVILDERNNSLYLARDYSGEKPLYYILDENSQVGAFSSEINSFTKLKNLSLSIDHQSVWDMPTFLWVPEPKTIYNEVLSVPPNCYLKVNNQGYSIHNVVEREERNWHGLHAVDLVNTIHDVVYQSVKDRCVSDAPIGCFLSGGIDSAIITSIAAEARHTIDTFNLAFEDVEDPYHGKADESIFAAESAAHFGTKHHTIKVSSKEFKESLPQFLYHAGQPYAVSSGLGVYQISKYAAALGIKVLLSGDGADECFGGYSWYEHIPSVFKYSQKKQLDASDDVTMNNSGLSLDDRLRHLSSYSKDKQGWAWHYYASEKEKLGIFTSDLNSEVVSSVRFFEKLSRDVSLNAPITHDRSFYLPNEMLSKVDRMCMAHGIESRAPFTARSVIQLADSLAYEDQVSVQGGLKWSLKKAFSDHLPDFITARPKHGFNVPIDYWFKHDWADMIDDYFASDCKIVRDGFVIPNAAERLKDLANSPNKLNGHSVLSFVCLSMWMENHAS